MSPETNKTEKANKQVVIIGTILVLGAIGFLAWKFFLDEPQHDVPPVPATRTAPTLDFEYLESDEFEYFEEYESIDPPEEGDLGRDNPFLPY